MDLPSKPIRTYALLVCFVSLLSGSVALVFALYDVVQIGFPESTNTSVQRQIQQVQAHQSALRLQQQLSPIDGVSTIQPGIVGTTNSEALANQLAAIQVPEPNHEFFISSAIQSLIISTIVIFVSSLVFFFHWRLAHA